MLYEGICGGSVYHNGRCLLGTASGAGETAFCRQDKKGKTVGIVISIVVTAVICSLVLTTSGLVCFSRVIISIPLSRADWFSL